MLHAKYTKRLYVQTIGWRHGFTVSSNVWWICYM